MTNFTLQIWFVMSKKCEKAKPKKKANLEIGPRGSAGGGTAGTML